MNQAFQLLGGGGGGVTYHVERGGNAICDRVQLLTLMKTCGAMDFVCALFFPISLSNMFINEG